MKVLLLQLLLDGVAEVVLEIRQVFLQDVGLLVVDVGAGALAIFVWHWLVINFDAEVVLGYFGKAAAQLMAMGFAIQFKNGDDVLMRIYPDIHLKGGNINLQRAQEIDPEVTDLTMENVGDLATKVGISVKVRCETEVKFTELLDKEGYSVERKQVRNVPYVAKKTTDGNDTGGGANQGDNQGGQQQGGGELEP